MIFRRGSLYCSTKYCKAFKNTESLYPKQVHHATWISLEMEPIILGKKYDKYEDNLN